MKVKVFLQALKATKNTIWDPDKGQKYLDSLFDPAVTYNDRVKKWVNSRIKSDLTNSDDTTEKITKATLQSDDPDWAKAKVNNGDDVYRVKFPTKINSPITAKYKEWIDYLETNLEKALAAGRNFNLEAITPLQMPLKIRLYKKELEEKENQDNSGYTDFGTQIIKVYTGKEGEDFEKGFHWVRLLSSDALEKEGDRMRNCIGRLHIDNILSGNELAYSLRDRRNHPWVDLAFKLSDGIINFDTLRGPANSDISARFKPYVLDLLNSKKDMKVMRTAYMFSQFKPGAITLKNIDTLEYLRPEEKEQIKKLISTKFRGAKLIPYKKLAKGVAENLGAFKDKNGFHSYKELPNSDKRVIYVSDDESYRVITCKSTDGYNNYVTYIINVKNSSGKYNIEINCETEGSNLNILDVNDVSEISLVRKAIIGVGNNKELHKKMGSFTWINKGVWEYGVFQTMGFGGKPTLYYDIDNIPDTVEHKVLYKCDDYTVYFFKKYVIISIKDGSVLLFSTNVHNEIERVIRGLGEPRLNNGQKKVVLNVLNSGVIPYKTVHMDMVHEPDTIIVKVKDKYYYLDNIPDSVALYVNKEKKYRIFETGDPDYVIIDNRNQVATISNIDYPRNIKFYNVEEEIVIDALNSGKMKVKDDAIPKHYIRHNKKYYLPKQVTDEQAIWTDKKYPELKAVKNENRYYIVNTEVGVVSWVDEDGTSSFYSGMTYDCVRALNSGVIKISNLDDNGSIIKINTTYYRMEDLHAVPSSDCYYENKALGCKVVKVVKGGKQLYYIIDVNSLDKRYIAMENGSFVGWRSYIDDIQYLNLDVFVDAINNGKVPFNGILPDNMSNYLLELDGKWYSFGNINEIPKSKIIYSGVAEHHTLSGDTQTYIVVRDTDRYYIISTQDYKSTKLEHGCIFDGGYTNDISRVSDIVVDAVKNLNIEVKDRYIERRLGRIKN